MAGGAALNIFRMGKSGLPKSVFNRHLWLAVLTFGLMGAARGVDEGLITGATGPSEWRRCTKLTCPSVDRYLQHECLQGVSPSRHPW